MTYGKFAYLYDELMKDVPYEEWVEFINRQIKKYGISGMKLLDLACGTGELSIRLAQAGFTVTGVDLSNDMLAVAREKADTNGQSLFLVEQDMSELEGLGEFDVICIFCDSLNYLQTESSVVQTFERVREHLKPGGLFLFDVHSLYKMNELFIDQTYAYNGEEISYIWQCFAGEDSNSVEHELTFFELDHASNLYHRYDELHFQHTFPIEQYEKWLADNGFEILSITADFQDRKPSDKSERIFFTTRK
jgi:ubiquinone/menaquinone biosynthesis C-methylase UbiE